MAQSEKNIEERYSLDNSIRINGSFTLPDRYSNRNFKFNGYDISVNGNVYIGDRDLYLGEGTLNCEGNCILYSSYLHMENSEEEINIKGDFLFESGSTSNHMIDEVLSIGGNSTINSSNFKPDGENKVVFNGKGNVQEVSINYADSYFNKVSFEGSKVVFKTPCKIAVV